jgi:TonB-dependent receptor
VTAGYVMAQGRFGRDGFLGRTGYLTGVRTEKTETKSKGWVRARVPSTAAQQLADPVGAARRDYENNGRALSGSYTKSFPSIHLNHDVTSNLKARLSWSTSFGRPAMTTALPSETVSEANRTLSVSNPALHPQTAENWDATLEYYFEPVGNFAVGWFHKTIKDYIVSGIDSGTIGTGPDNGYNGEYSGFTRLTTSNAGTAIVQGWEFAYQQQFTFLPGLLKGLALSANYTVLDTHGDFGGRTYVRTGQVAGFTPRTSNVSLSWRYHGFSARVLTNYNSSGITAYSAVSPALNLYRKARTMVSVGAAYQIRPSLSLTLDVDNLFNEPQVHYRGIPDRTQRTVLNGVVVIAGVSGRF